MSAARERLGWAAGLAAALVWLGVIGLARAGVPAPARLLSPVTALLAALVQALVGWTGIDALRHGALLYVPGEFAYEIVAGCTGLLPAGVLAVAILTAPANGRARRAGLLAGVPLLLAVNVVRLAHLFYLGVRAPRHFALAHGLVWEAAMIAAVVAIWLGWSRWAARRGWGGGGAAPAVSRLAPAAR